MEYRKVLDLEPYAMAQNEKEQVLSKYLIELTKYHYAHCLPYQKILDAGSVQIDHMKNYYEIPFLPVRIFKEYDLRSTAQEEIQKTLTSSGTSGQQVSKIYLDKETSANQTRVLTKITASYLGKKRMPMIIIDTAAVLKERAMFSARGAGILGFSMFAKDKFYALDENMQLDAKGLQAFLNKHEGEELFLFGFTFMIWKHFYQELLAAGYKLDLSKGIMIHGGGWKKLDAEAVTSEQFKEKLREVCGIKRVHNYYGMAEQTGSIYMECEYGHLHAPVYSDVIVRRVSDFSVADIGEEGLIEVVSVLPKSYPGHALLTEDRGILLGEDDCPCKRPGKYFKVLGRIKNAEIRGCSDTYAARF